mgnify:CR=1 FL=1|jgi:hypothetical protein
MLYITISSLYVLSDRVDDRNLEGNYQMVERQRGSYPGLAVSDES